MDEDDKFEVKIVMLVGIFLLFCIGVILLTFAIDKYAETQTAKEAIHNGYVQEYVDGKTRPIWVKPKDH